MDSATIELTDSSKELAVLAQLIRNSAGGSNTIAGLSRCVGIDLGNPEFLDVLAAIQRRVREVESLANSVDDTDFDQDLKGEVLTATHSFAQLLNPKNANSGWDQARANYLPDKNITALKFFSQTARRYRPLRVVPQEAQDEAVNKIREVIDQVQKDNDLEQWMKVAIVSGLERTLLVLRYLRFFGHDIAITELFLVHQRLAVVAHEAEATQSKSHSIWQALIVLSVLSSLFVLPDQALTAFDRYKTWSSVWSDKILTMISAPLIPPDQHLLPAPAMVPGRPPEETFAPAQYSE